MVVFWAYLLASGVVAVTPSLAAALGPLNHALAPSARDATPDSIAARSTESFESIFGPVVIANFPDPAVIYVDGLSYAFATNNEGVGPYGMIHIQIATSVDNQTWTILKGVDALPVVGNWHISNGTWAPDVVQLDDGSFVMYYAGRPKWAPKHHCIGAATSKSITGPYTPLDQPFACPDIPTRGGAIDPDGFLDPMTGKRYVTYKVDGNSIGHGGRCENMVAPIIPTPILLQEVDRTDGLSLIGEAHQILDRDEADGPLVEAPSLHLSDEKIYFLFYSSNCFTTRFYETRYATSTNIWGPYTKSRTALLKTGDGPRLLGPGGTDIVKGGNLIVFHGQLDSANVAGNLAEAHRSGGAARRRRGTVSLIRGMYTALATFQGTSVNLSGPIPGTK